MAFVYRGKPCKVVTIFDASARDVEVELMDQTIPNVRVNITHKDVNGFYDQADPDNSNIQMLVGATGQVAFEVGFANANNIAIYEMDPKYPLALGGAGRVVPYRGVQVRVHAVIWEVSDSSDFEMRIRFHFMDFAAPEGMFEVPYYQRAFVDAHVDRGGKTTVLPCVGDEGVLYEAEPMLLKSGWQAADLVGLPQSTSAATDAAKGAAVAPADTYFPRPYKPV